MKTSESSWNGKIDRVTIKSTKDYLLEDIERLTDKELGKVYRYVRRYIIAKIEWNRCDDCEYKKQGK